MNKILNYKTFRDTETFAKWQEECSPCIMTIQPVFESAGINEDGIRDAQIQIFVVYRESDNG